MEYIIILSSVTYALKGKKELDKNGIRTSLIKAQNVEELRGCGYGLKVKKEDKSKAEKILTSSGIKIVGISEEKR